MKFRLPWIKKNEYAELEAMETVLNSVFSPVLPSKKFTNKLRSELVGKPKRKFFGLEIPNAKMGWMLAGGIFGMVILVVNAILSILRFTKLVGKYGKKNKGHIQATV